MGIAKFLSKPGQFSCSLFKLQHNKDTFPYQDCKEVKACEVVVEKIKKRKRISKSPAVPSPTPSPALTSGGDGEAGAAAAAGEAARSSEPGAGEGGS